MICGNVDDDKLGLIAESGIPDAMSGKIPGYD